MPDIISAKCLGCGNIIKVPAALGGKKARCPQCTNTIVIPTAPSDTQFTEFITDDQLPEVARDGEIVRPEAGDAPIPGQEPEPEEVPSEMRRRGGTSVRGRVAPAPPAGSRTPKGGAPVARGGTSSRPNPAGGGNSNMAMIIGIGLAVVALVIAAVALMGGNGNSGHKAGSGSKPKEKGSEKDSGKTSKGPQYTEAEQALIARLMDYTGTVNRAEVTSILKFYAYEPDDERKMKLRVAQELIDKSVKYENVQVKSINAAGGTITFSHTGGEKTLTWKQSGDVWLIAEMPSP